MHDCATQGIGASTSIKIGDEPDEMGDRMTPVNLGDNFVPTMISTGQQMSCALSINHEVKVCVCPLSFVSITRKDNSETVLGVSGARWLLRIYNSKRRYDCAANIASKLILGVTADTQIHHRRWGIH